MLTHHSLIQTPVYNRTLLNRWVLFLASRSALELMTSAPQHFTSLVIWTRSELNVKRLPLDCANSYLAVGRRGLLQKNWMLARPWFISGYNVSARLARNYSSVFVCVLILRQRSLRRTV